MIVILETESIREDDMGEDQDDKLSRRNFENFGYGAVAPVVVTATTAYGMAGK